jgi:hypothetical protein
LEERPAALCGHDGFGLRRPGQEQAVEEFVGLALQQRQQCGAVGLCRIQAREATEVIEVVARPPR